MSRDNHLRSSRSRSISRYRNNATKSHRSRSPVTKTRSPVKRSRYQRERSRSFEKNGHRSNRGPTPTDIRRKNPDPSKVLGVFNLHVKTTEREIRDVFERFGPIDEIIMVKDAKTRGFRGYCFIYYDKQRDATEALNQCNGIELKERMIRVDYSLSEKPHQSTPGEYRGKRGRDVRGGGGSSRSQPYERTRYYDKHETDRTRYRHRSPEARDRYRRRSREYDRPSQRVRSPRDRYDRH